MDLFVFVMDDLLVERRSEGFVGQQLYWVPKLVLQRIETRPFTRDAVVSCLGYYPDAKGHFMERPDGIDDYVLIFVEDGAGWVEIGGKRREIGAGEVMLLPPRVPHAYGADQANPWTLFWIHFRGRTVEELLEWTSFSTQTQVMTFAAWDAIRRQFHSLFISLERGYHDHNLLEMSRVLINVLTLLHRNSSRERPQDARDRIERAMDRIRETIANPRTLDEYAREAGYSVPRFSHWFKHFTGVSPMTYLTELRIQSACEYLDTTSMTIKQIAALLGYDDPYYFSRTFTKCTGLCPLKYRKGGSPSAALPKNSSKQENAPGSSGQSSQGTTM